MKELNLSRVLVENRHKLGITQDTLAEYIGVSKAAISKWETGTTYPDILMLPRLAAYFDISIDELLGYEPQMSKEDIRKLYKQLSEEFSSIPFDDVMVHCRKLIKKYYSCYPLLFHIGSLFVNHSMLAGSPEKTTKIIEEAMQLFIRVKNGDDPVLGKEALQLEAYCLLFLNRPNEVFNLLDTDQLNMNSSEPLLASAYQAIGNNKEAKRILQVGIYKGIVSLINFLIPYMDLNIDNANIFEETCHRIQFIIDAFQLTTLHPGLLLSCYIIIAQGFITIGHQEKALDFLEKYTTLAISNIYPLRLHGDWYFNFLDEWIENNLDLGNILPRDNSIIRYSITKALTDNPNFAVLADNPRFNDMVLLLKNNEEDK